MVVDIIMNTLLIIDFDSTFITGESLDWLAEEALKSKSAGERRIILSQIEAITQAGMEGSRSFEDSLRQRLSLFQPNKYHIEQLVKRIEQSVTPSFVKNREFIQQNATNIRIVSGGFHEYMDPILMSFGIPQENIYGNTFLFEGDEAIGFDSENALSKPGGKGKVVKELNLDGKVIVIGDGYTDYEIVQSGAGDIFIAFTENITRDFVHDLKPLQASSFESVLSYLSPSSKERVV